MVSVAKVVTAATHGNVFTRTISKVFILPQTLFGRIYFGLFATTALTYVLFQKKLLPKPVSKVVSKIFFLPTFPITALMRLGNYWTTLDDTAYLGCAPMGIAGHPKQLHKLGVRGVINMCYEYEGPKDAYAALGIKQLHLPVVDHFEPSLGQLQVRTLPTSILYTFLLVPSLITP